MMFNRLTTKMSLRIDHLFGMNSRQSWCIVLLFFIMELVVTSPYEISIPTGEQKFSLVVRDKITPEWTYIQSQSTRSVLECMKICLTVKGSYVVTFLPDKNCHCQNFNGLHRSRQAHPGARIYQLQYCEFLL